MTAVAAHRGTRRAPALPPDERRAMIVQATLPLLLEHGEMVTTRQIAEAAGIAEGTIFRAFADKDELVAAVVDAALDHAPLESALAAIDQSAPWPVRIETAVAVVQQRVVDVWRLLSSVGVKHHRSSGPPPASGELVKLLSAPEARLRLDPETGAERLRALTLAVTHPMLTGTPASPADIVELFLNGARHAPVPPTKEPRAC